MRKFLAALILIPLLLSCSQYQKVLKSTDYEFKYAKAMEYFEKEDFMRAATLLNELQGVYRGTDKAETINYTYASCLYGLNDYIMAGHYYRQFVKTFPSSQRNEECQFMSGYCYYMTSPKPRLDQTDTYNAINEFQLFVNLYPRSERVAEANRLMDELRDKLVYKSYLSAKLYFGLGDYMGNNYLSAVIAAQNSLKEFPDTKYREELSFLILEAKYIQAVNSVISKKEERMRDAIDEYFSFINEFPESQYLNRAVKIYNDAAKNINFEETN
ncbi:Beta-barrel assembly machine subunit BamD [Saccharicrinis carchari]|uniref:Beta-barrel assembly machine subunit BamD n=1 Tax=Saccharicrinis carchari TaxID=1168039 RepID=A0A521B1M0_SACCC|nr:outer membrane protein assembly factor BamD [Saccharicrinis carchari]SMO41003.1 Beta-barrel assembly machine subunit BamD [Saccharicrinis carchari]